MTRLTSMGEGTFRNNVKQVAPEILKHPCAAPMSSCKEMSYFGITLIDA
jgi:hypothetical protein